MIDEVSVACKIILLFLLYNQIPLVLKWWKQFVKKNENSEKW